MSKAIGKQVFYAQLGMDRAMGETERTGVADEAWQTPRPARIRNEAEPRKCLHEARRARRDHEIAGQRQVRAGARRHAIDRRDHRQGKAAQRQNQRLVILVDRLAEIDGLAAGCDGAIAEILPRAEASSGAGEHQHARAFRRERRQRLADLFVHLHVEAVELVRAVEGQPCDAVFDDHQDRFIGHRRAP